MKKMIGLLLVVFMLYGCSGSGFDSEACYLSVRKMFPEARIFGRSVGEYYNWIVITPQNRVFVVVTGSSFSPKISEIKPAIEFIGSNEITIKMGE